MLAEDIIQDATTQITAITNEVQKAVIWQARLVRNLIIALLAKGHILLEWVPGLAKTLSIETLSKALWVSFSRIQFTPDLLPSDLIGTRVFDPAKVDFVTRKWPIFAHLLLADEINRAPAKVQSALLEAMAERQVTIGEEKFVLDAPFVVMATQNPLEQEGTYALPEAQLDRFLLKTIITYPTPEEEIQIMQQKTVWTDAPIEALISKEQILALQNIVEQIYVSDALYSYVKNLVFATRYPTQYWLDHLSAFIEWWVSPRASLALIQCAKVVALMAWRAYLLPEDIKDVAHEAMRHRLVLRFEALATGIWPDEIITTILDTIPVVEEEASS